MRRTMEEILFSIIIPIYNIKKYLKKCVESVLCQSYDNYEVLLIDDGSTDGSGEECDKYKKIYSQIKVIHKKNEGVSAARNTGVEKSEGEYIIFLDGDDYWNDNHALDKIYKSVMETHAEIIAFQGYDISELSGVKTRISNNYTEKMREKIYDGQHYLKTVLTGRENFYWYAWLYAIRRSYWEENGFFFNERTRVFEDVELMYFVLLKCAQIKVTDFTFYHYRTKRDGSLTTVHDIGFIEDILKVAEKILKQAEKSTEKEFRKIVQNHFAHNYYLCCIFANDLKKDHYKIIKKKLEEKMWMAEYTYEGRDFLLKLLIHIVGVNVVVKLLGLRKRIKEEKKWKNTRDLTL